MSATSATPDEAAAIVAALERFMRATAPAGPESAPEQLAGWRATAMLEGVSRDPWTDTDAWLGAAQ